MANHDSAIKAHKQSLQRRDRNRQYRSRLRKALKTIRTSIQAGKAEDARAALPETVSLIDKLVGKGIIHDNAAGRYKSRLMKQIREASAAGA
jgi:small subunit ribosomal protein S20